VYIGLFFPGLEAVGICMLFICGETGTRSLFPFAVVPDFRKKNLCFRKFMMHPGQIDLVGIGKGLFINLSSTHNKYFLTIRFFRSFNGGRNIRELLII
jgi:hypothetical protein